MCTHKYVHSTMIIVEKELGLNYSTQNLKMIDVLLYSLVLKGIPLSLSSFRQEREPRIPTEMVFLASTFTGW